MLINDAQKSPALQRLKPGDVIGCAHWDRTVAPDMQLGRAEIVAIYPYRSQSGWMIRLRAQSGRTLDLDSDWVIR